MRASAAAGGRRLRLLITWTAGWDAPTPCLPASCMGSAPAAHTNDVSALWHTHERATPRGASHALAKAAAAAQQRAADSAIIFGEALRQ